MLSPSGGPFDRYNWNKGDTLQSISINDAGKYWLQTTDPIGCITYNTINVRSNNSDMVFPNAFTPKSDQGRTTYSDSIWPYITAADKSCLKQMMLKMGGMGGRQAMTVPLVFICMF